MATGDIKRAFQSLQTMTVTALQSLASSATAGWQSCEVDNTTTLFEEIALQVVLDYSGTSPANSKGALVFLASGLETGKLSNPASGIDAAITLCDVTTTVQSLQQIGFIPYTNKDEVAESSVMTFPAPPYWSVVVVNYSGAALDSSGNTVKYRGVYDTVAS